MTIIEKAKIEDVKEIHKLVNQYSRKGLMLYRFPADIEQKIRDYFVCKVDNKIIGCVALKIWNRRSAEICSLAVDQEYVGKTIGTKLVKSCIVDAKKLKIPFVFALTFRHELFLRLGFKKINIKQLPKIVFTEKTVDVDKAYGFKF
jgi:amino-acid N-acetyltransferase